MTHSSRTSFEGTFEAHRQRLHRLAQRMLGSAADADDALQEVWLRARRADVSEVDNPAGWLTTITARVCLNSLRSRATRREDSGAELVARPGGESDEPEQQILLADSVGIAMVLVLEALPPVERVAFVLHDMFAVPFDEIAPIVGRSVETTRQLASRARRRLHDGKVRPDPDRGRTRELVDAFFAAARRGDLATLIAVLHPDAVLHHDTPDGERGVVHGAESIARRAIMFTVPHATLVPIVFGDDPGVVVEVDGQPVAMMIFVSDDGAITSVDTITTPAHLAEVGLGPR